MQMPRRLGYLGTMADLPTKLSEASDEASFVKSHDVFQIPRAPFTSFFSLPKTFQRPRKSMQVYAKSSEVKSEPGREKSERDQARGQKKDQ
jgi:hypothetical protein